VLRVDNSVWRAVLLSYTVSTNLIPIRRCGQHIWSAENTCRWRLTAR